MRRMPQWQSISRFQLLMLLLSATMHNFLTSRSTACLGTCFDSFSEDVAHNNISVQDEVEATMTEHGVLPVVHPPPFYGDPADVPERPPIIAGVQFRVPSTALGDLKPFVWGDARSGSSAMDMLRSKMVRMEYRPASTGEAWGVNPLAFEIRSCNPQPVALLLWNMQSFPMTHFAFWCRIRACLESHVLARGMAVTRTASRS